MVILQSLVYAFQRALEADGSRIFLPQIQLAFAYDLCYVVMVGKGGVAYPSQSLVGLAGLAQRTVVSAHVAQHAYVVVVRVYVRFYVGLCLYLPQVERVELVVQLERCELLVQLVECDGAIEYVFGVRHLALVVQTVDGAQHHLVVALVA